MRVAVYQYLSAPQTAHKKRLIATIAQLQIKPLKS